MLEALYRVGKSTISQSVPEVCGVISTSLKDFIKVSTSLHIFGPSHSSSALLTLTSKSGGKSQKNVELLFELSFI